MRRTLSGAPWRAAFHALIRLEAARLKLLSSIHDTCERYLDVVLVTSNGKIIASIGRIGGLVVLLGRDDLLQLDERRDGCSIKKRRIDVQRALSRRHYEA